VNETSGSGTVHSGGRIVGPGLQNYLVRMLSYNCGRNICGSLPAMLFAAFADTLFAIHSAFAPPGMPVSRITPEALSDALAAYMVCSSGVGSLEWLGVHGVTGDPLADCPCCALQPDEGGYCNSLS
jgi:hypothetical protein